MAEQKFNSSHREYLAMVREFLLLRRHLEGTLLRASHEALKCKYNLVDSKGKLMQWRLSLPEFDFKIVH